MSPEDIGDIRKIFIRLAMVTKVGVDFLYSLPFIETLEMISALSEVQKEAKRGKK